MLARHHARRRDPMLFWPLITRFFDRKAGSAPAVGG
jgi:hypothetical protein